MRLLLVLLLSACAADSDATQCPPWPDVALVKRAELDGTCGPVPDLLARAGDPVPDGCTFTHETDKPACFTRNRLTCASGTVRDWWLDGSSGRWIGEERMTLASGCASTYRLELQPR